MDHEYKVVNTFEKQNDQDKSNTSLFRSYTNVEGKEKAPERGYTEHIEKQRETETNRKINQDALNSIFNQSRTSVDPQPTKLIEKKKSFESSKLGF
jgi:hypothetical protein